MVQFEKNKEGIACIKIEIRGEKENYIDLIKSLLTLVRLSPGSYDLQDEINDVCNLVESMLPDHDQVINKEDVILLEKLKTQKK